MTFSLKTLTSASVSAAVLAAGVAGISQPAVAKKLSGEEIAVIAILGTAAIVAASSGPRCVQKTKCKVDIFGDEVCRTRTVCR